MGAKSDRARLEWTPRAASDLRRIGDHIARDAPLAAERWVTKLIAAAERAASAPMTGRRVPELGRDDLREVIEGRYRVIYRTREARIDVLTVFEGHRLLTLRDDEIA